ncbi:putative permease of ABC transporter [Candidatus Vecturithrix granuli]|uniref:Putative permease of ABC transporter n=1 Tax=Vecturithrix granuli TaxID=1499967 RepID=A0A081C3I7_VECG1|nr:putative permease of ABC transporter [Candidatus Vecturithrix granuli]
MKTPAWNILKRSEVYLILVIALLVFFLTFKTEDFFSIENFFDILISNSFLGIMAAGFLVVLISGGIDISFTATATVAQYVVASYIIKYDGNWLIAFGMAAAIGLTLGAVNAFLVHYLKVSAIIITISTLNIFYGILIFLTRGKWLYNFPDWFYDGISLYRFTTTDKTTYSISIPIFVFLGVLLLTGFILNKTVIGRKIYALGGNLEAAKRMGFGILGLHVFVYCYLGLLAGIAAIVQAHIVQTVAPNAIVGRELEVVAAVVLGGASLAGGRGTLLGTILGVTLVAVMQNGLTLLGVSSYWHKVVIGLVILMSVSLTAYQRKREAKQGAEIIP